MFLDLFLKSQWMKKWQEEAGNNQSFTRQQWKYITISRVLQRRHHNNCVSLIVIDEQCFAGVSLWKN
jgi:hypothetical protein